MPFVIFEWLVWELPADNQRVSDSVFKVKRIIYIVRLDNLLYDGVHVGASPTMPCAPPTIQRVKDVFSLDGDSNC